MGARARRSTRKPRFGRNRKNPAICAATGKIRYRDGDDAAMALRSLRARASSAESTGGTHRIHVCRKYRCDDCGGWHLTSMAAWERPQPAPGPATQGKVGTPSWRGAVPDPAPL